MSSFGNTSIRKLETCHADWQLILNEAIKKDFNIKLDDGTFVKFDFTVVEGHRSLETQQKYFKEGHTTCDGIVKKSFHQSSPSMAVDLVPYHSGGVHWDDQKLWKILARVIFDTVQNLKDDGLIKKNIRWGGFWTSFDDKPHWELR